MKRKKPETTSIAKAGILALVEIKAATEAFDRGETNVYDALDAIIVAVEAYRSTEHPRQEAA